MSDKYITFKREDWEAMPDSIRNIYQNTLDTMAKKEIMDAVVIRKQDAFAGPALHTYAGSIGVAARAIGELAPSTRDRLQKIADYFHGQAVEADELQGKLPD